ncbi:hypothetical protein R1sor_016668 [Riccia sorocarpa]|uniref:Uncharacterized protein n=1 Tax=Riccia sorocarpa TaxID=122646 RepID=A0ABD3HIZ6_9MARC
MRLVSDSPAIIDILNVAGGSNELQYPTLACHQERLHIIGIDRVDDVFDNRTHRIGRDRRFVLKGILIWTMHDYPGFGAISGFQTKSYCACPICTYMLPYG